MYMAEGLVVRQGIHPPFYACASLCSESLLKTYNKTLDEGFFCLVVVDAINLHVRERLSVSVMGARNRM